MNRREVLRNMGLGMGFLIVGPSTFSLLQSCQNAPTYDWKPTFLSASNGFALKYVLDLIIPKTETPGAIELNIPKFIDSYMNEVAPIERGENFKKVANAFADAFERDFGKAHEDGTKEDFDKIIKKYLLATPAQRDEYVLRLAETQDPQNNAPKVEIDTDAGAYAYLTNVRDLGIWAWKTSEQVGENVLWYDPIPGEWIPCGPVEELGGGRDMSL